MRLIRPLLTCAALLTACGSDPEPAQGLGPSSSGAAGKGGAAGQAGAGTAGGPSAGKAGTTSGGGSAGALPGGRAGTAGAGGAGVCEPGKLGTCNDCPDGLTHNRTCNKDGSAWSACECPAGGAGGQAGAAGETGGVAGQGGASGQAGSGDAGQAGATVGGAGGACQLGFPSSCSCATARSATAEGKQVCLPGASSPSCDCSSADPVYGDANAAHCKDVDGTSVAVRTACVGDAEFTDCRHIYQAGLWAPRFCADPLGGPTTAVAEDGKTYPVQCCKPVGGKPEPICNLPGPSCGYLGDQRQLSSIPGKPACDPETATAMCEVKYAPYAEPAEQGIETCAAATGLAPPVAATSCDGEPLFTRCKLAPPVATWPASACVSLGKEVQAADGSKRRVYCCLPPQP